MTTAITGVIHEAIALDAFEASIREGYRRFVSTAYESLEAAAQIGRDLATVKDGLKHGEFLPWIEEHCTFSRQLACMFVRCADGQPAIANVTSSLHLPAPSVETTATLATFDGDTQKEIIDEWQDAEGDMLPIIRRHRRDQKIAKRVENAGDLAKPDGEITKRVGIILADPPWQYRFSPTTSRQIENQYPTESAEGLAALKPKIDSWSMNDCILYMWATSPKNAEAVALMAAWGFDYRTCAVWDKQIDGMGKWFRQRHELLLVGVRGQFEGCVLFLVEI